MLTRTNRPAALTRKIRKLLGDLPVKVKSDEYTGCATIQGEIEYLSRAVAIISAITGLECTGVHTYKAIPASVYVKFAE